MLEKADMEAIRQIMKEEIAFVDEKIMIRNDKTESILLDEIVRTQKYIETVQSNLEELKQYYRIAKLENDNTALLLQMIAELQKRVAELEKKTA